MPQPETSRSMVIFRIGAEEYAVAVESVNGIIRYEEPTPVPRAPLGVLGVINLRGSVIPVVDLTSRLAVAAFVPKPGSRIVVCEGAPGRFGVAVDSANEVAKVAVDEIRPVPEGILSAETHRAFVGVIERDGSLVIVLDIDEIIPRVDFGSAQDTQATEGDVDV